MYKLQNIQFIESSVRHKNNLPKSIVNLITTKNKTRRLWNTLKIPELKKELNLLTNITKKVLNNYKQQQYNCMIQSLTTKNNSLWQFTKKILKKKTHIPPLNTTTGKKYSPFDKAETLAKHFSETFTPNDTPPLPIHTNILQISNAPLYNVPQRINYISPHEIWNIIKRLPNKKAPGHDKINNIIIKNLPPSAIAYINNIYNSILRTGYFPQNWKHSVVLPIAKPNKNRTNPENYRPISLLPTLSKILEKLILKRLTNYLSKINIIPKHQFGFTEHLSTSHQLLRITEHIHTAFQKHQYTLTTFLDITQAFDRIWHQGLIYKLKINGTPNYLIKLIQSFISNRTFSVSVDNHQSNPYTIQAGLPQGSPLSPLLFNLYTADLPTSKKINTAQFADDTALFISDTTLTDIRNKMQQHLNLIENWSNTWKIKLNPSKSIAKIFSLRTITTPAPLIINNNPIPWSPQNKTVKYLGLHLDTRLNWKSHIENKIRQIKIKLLQLKPLINRNSIISLDNSMTLYKSIIRPTLLYACPIWTNASDTNINKFQIIQNKFLRVITHAPWYITNNQLHQELSVKPIKHHIAYLSHNFFTNLPFITSPAFYRLGKNPPYNTRIKNRYPLHAFYKMFSNLDQ